MITNIRVPFGRLGRNSEVNSFGNPKFSGIPKGLTYFGGNPGMFNGKTGDTVGILSLLACA